MLSTLIVALIAAGYGTAAGALLPRAVYRLAVQPAESWRAECPQGHPLLGPVRGWLGRARCPACARSTAAEATCLPDVSWPHESTGLHESRSHAPAPKGMYGPRSSFLMATSSACCAALALAVGPRPELAVWLLIAPPTLLLVAVDLSVQRLPDILTLPLAVVTATMLGLAALLPGARGSWEQALCGGAALAGAYFILFLLKPHGMGFGDVKLALTPGIALGWYGWDVLAAGSVLGFLLFAGYGMTLILTRRAGSKTPLPFAPFMTLGVFAGLLAGGAAA